MAVNGERKDYENLGPIICPGHIRTVCDLEFTNDTEDGYFLLSGDFDSKAMLREGKSGDWIGTFLGHKGAVHCARSNPDVTLIVTASGDYSAKLWSGITGENVYTFDHARMLKSCCFSRDSNYVMTGGMDKILRIFDVHKREADPKEMRGHNGTINSIVESKDPNLIMSFAGKETMIRIWDRRTLKCEKTLETNVNINSMTKSIDGSTICTTGGKQVQLWDAGSFEMVKTFHLDYEANCAAFHKKIGGFVAGGVQDLCAFDFKTGKLIQRSKGHHGSVRCLAFSPTGMNYASGAEDGTIRIWDWCVQKGQQTTHPQRKQEKDELS